ncbi:MAG: endopeptidase La [Acidaminococcaceae bacterium]|uniref:endopeptidase La n=1 Tax=Succiniclasticum sp. TaxID=2775030 RepID=UPI001B279B19|nr:endopeptidase La [Succiniclasticum sp.]MBO5590731.1 endopeptidase La [Acidaminococcaceae bacterium]MBP3811635.1 endopeptidase La [Acidaminococcaceae bacterium]MDY6291974.1 endopeptidase La [Succiniclasticum sp.]
MNTISRILPLLPLRGMVIFPGMVMNLDIARLKSLHAVNAAMRNGKKILIVSQVRTDQEEPELSNLYKAGVVAEIKQMLKLPGGAVRILVEGLCRASVDTVAEDAEGCWQASYRELIPTDRPEEGMELEALRRIVISEFEKWVLSGKKISPEILLSFKDNPNAGIVADTIAGYLDVDLEKRQELLETVPVKDRLEKLYGLLHKEMAISELEKSIAKKVHQNIEKNQKEYYLREQLKVINKELGDEEDVHAEAQEYRERIKTLPLPEEVVTGLNKEVDRLFKMPPMMADSAVIRNYLDTVLELPWGKYDNNGFDISKAARILDQHHYGLKKVKERILEHLAVQKLAKTNKAPILCLVGPPGVGKTSMAESIAEAVNRKFTRVSLGGVRDEAEIRGHRRTYIGAMPGRLIHGMKKVGCLNPLFLLDEVDKMASDFRGDPASALLEALDPEQNHAFSDHFIEYPFDLSSVFWIVTANTVETIPPALLDRLEVIELSSYTEDEKLNIAKLHLIPKEMEANGLTKESFSITPGAIRKIIRDYTREAGVRRLERQIAKLCRKTAYRIVTGNETSAAITVKNLSDYLGPCIYLESDLRAREEIGIVTGLAWTSVGGEMLKVEVLTSEGKGALTLTGQLGDVMKESARAGYTFIRSRYKELGLPADFYDKTDIHIHLPEGAIPKDGPSAGITMVTAMVSALTGRKVKADLAMTGEITLSGKVLPVGGIKEKMLAAHRYGVKTVLLPERNMQDLTELPQKVLDEIRFVPVSHMDEVLRLALKPLKEEKKTEEQKQPV